MLNIFLYLKTGDYLASLLYLTVIIFSFFNISIQEKPQFVEIKHGDSTWVYSLDKDLVVQPVNDIESCELLIENKTVRVISSNCPLKICIQMGEIKQANQWIACLPHKIFISITGSEDITDREGDVVDAIAY